MRLVGVATGGLPHFSNQYVPIGGMTALIGPNDSGKSTLLRLIDRAFGSNASDDSLVCCELEVAEVAALFLDHADNFLGASPPSDEWMADRLSGLDRSTWDPIIAQLRNSRYFAFRPIDASDYFELESSEAHRAYWCLPPAEEIGREAANLARQALCSSAGPIAGHVGEFVLRDPGPHAILSGDDAPIPVLALGISDHPMPSKQRAIVVPVAPAEVERRVEDAVDRRVQSQRPDGDGSRAWYAEGTDGAWKVHPVVHRSVGALQHSMNSLLPDFIRLRYRLVIQVRPIPDWAPRKLDLWLQPADRDSAGGSDGELFQLNQLADGFQIWMQLAILEAALQPQQLDLPADPRDTPSLSPVDSTGRSQAWDPLDEPDARPRALYIVDEPEQHLHPLLQRRAAGWLTDLVQHGGSSAVIATHAPAFLNRVAAGHEILWVSRGSSSSNTSVQRISRSDLMKLEGPARELGLTHGELLALVNVFLFVEGRTDMVVLDALFGDKLRDHGIETVPLQGYYHLKAAVEAAEVLLTFSSATFAVWLDSVPQQFIDELKQTPERAWKLKKDAPSPEAKAMADLVDVAHRQGILFHPLANPGVDVLFLLHEGAVKAVFPEYPGHVEALAMKRRKEESRADWYQSLIRNPKRVSAFQEIAEKMGELRLKPHPDLPAVVAEACRVAENSARSR